MNTAGFLTAFVSTAILLLEAREHLFSPDLGTGTPLGLWEVISASLVFSVGYVFCVSLSPEPVCCRVEPASC
jgi:hypothetical protein